MKSMASGPHQRQSKIQPGDKDKPRKADKSDRDDGNAQPVGARLGQCADEGRCDDGRCQSELLEEDTGNKGRCGDANDRAPRRWSKGFVLALEPAGKEDTKTERGQKEAEDKRKEARSHAARRSDVVACCTPSDGKAKPDKCQGRLPIRTAQQKPQHVISSKTKRPPPVRSERCRD